MTDVQHSRIGASSAERFWQCPGSVTLYGQMSNTTSFYAAQGTAAHQLAEDHLKARAILDTKKTGSPKHLSLLAENRFGETLQVRDDNTKQVFDIPVDAEMIEAVLEYADFIASEIDKYNSPWNRLRVEVGFSLAHIDPNAFGTCDAVLYVPYNRIIVIDYKHGAGVAVEIDDNKQTKYYGLGAYYDLPEDERSEIQYIETVIVQPRCPHKDGFVRRAVYTVADLLEWESGLSAAIKRVRDGDETLNAGTHCKFCPGKPHCPEAKNEVARLAGVDFQDVTLGPPDVETLTPEQIAHLLQFIPFIKEWCDGVMKHAHVIAEQGVEVPGYKLADKRSRRKWRDGAEEDLEMFYGNAIYDRKVLSPKQLETILPKSEKATLERFWEKPPAGKTLVKVDDDREARLPKAIADFIDVEL